MSLVAGSATGLYLTNVGNFACIDALGVYSPNAQWAEWLTLAPLLSYIAIAVEDKPEQLTFADITVIASLFLCILLGYVMNFSTDPSVGWILFIASSVTMMGNILKVNSKKIIPIIKTKNDGEEDVPLPQWELERSLMKSKLAWLLVVGYPAFPTIYLLSYFNVIDKDQLLVGYMVGGFVMKFLFIATISLESTMLQVAAERRMVESRRNFLRYIFHNVRVPLNTLTMGVSVLKADLGKGQKINGRDIISMMEGSAENMANALNDVLSLNKVEDGTMRLELRVISMKTLVQSAVMAVQEYGIRKGVRVTVEGLPYSLLLPQPRASRAGFSPEEYQYLVRGDASRLEDVLVHFLRGAIHHAAQRPRDEFECHTVRVKVSKSVMAPRAAQGEDWELDPRDDWRRDDSMPGLDKMGEEGSPEGSAGGGGAGGAGAGGGGGGGGVGRERGPDERGRNGSFSSGSLDDPPPDEHMGLMDGLDNSSCKTVEAIAPPRNVATVIIAVIDSHPRTTNRTNADENLGLVVSNQIIQLHGGDMIAKPRLDGPSVYGFELPVHTAFDTARTVPKHHHPALPTHRMSASGGQHVTSQYEAAVSAEMLLHARRHRQTQLHMQRQGPRHEYEGRRRDPTPDLEVGWGRGLRAGQGLGLGGEEHLPTSVRVSNNVDANVDVDVVATRRSIDATPVSGDADDTRAPSRPRASRHASVSFSIPLDQAQGHGNDPGPSHAHSHTHAHTHGPSRDHPLGVVEAGHAPAAATSSQNSQHTQDSASKGKGKDNSSGNEKGDIISKALAVARFFAGSNSGLGSSVDKEGSEGSGSPKSSLRVPALATSGSFTAPAPAPVPAPTALRRVMVVDDVASARKILCGLLARTQQFDVVEAADGVEAMLLYERWVHLWQCGWQAGSPSACCCDLIFLDLEMPDMDGPATATDLRSVGYTGLIVAVTASTSAYDHQRFLAAGADCLYTKPFRLSDMTMLLRYLQQGGFTSTPMVRAGLRDLATQWRKV